MGKVAFAKSAKTAIFHPLHLCLQAANVHAILESGPLVQKVQVRLNDSIGLIDDLDETLAIFDLKLRHMREDITAIEARNNRYLLSLDHFHNGFAMLSQQCLSS